MRDSLKCLTQYPDLLARGDETPNLGRRIDTLKREIEKVQEQARVLVIKQARAHSALTSIYDEQLQTIGERMDMTVKLSAPRTRPRIRTRNKADVPTLVKTEHRPLTDRTIYCTSAANLAEKLKANMI